MISIIKHKSLITWLAVLAGVLLCVSFAQPEDEDDFLKPKPLGNFSSLDIPLKKVGRIFLIEATVDSMTGNFIFDTGAPGLILNSTYFRDLDKVYNQTGGGITGANQELSRKKIEKLEIGELYFNKLYATVTNLGHIENKKGVKILGLIGVNLLKEFELIIDFNEAIMNISRLDKSGERMEPSPMECIPTVSHKIKVINNVILMKGQIGDKKLSFCLDTGAETNVLEIGLPDRIVNTVAINRRSVLHGTGQASSEVLYGSMTDFRIDNTALQGMNAVLTDLSQLNAMYGMQIDGMLGYDFFKQGVIRMNLKKKEIGICFKGMEVQE